MPARELCICQPLRPSSQHLPGYNESLASCNRIARDVERWRAAAFHHPDLADLFVDYQAMELSKSQGIQSLSVREEAYLDQIDSDKPPRVVSKTKRNLSHYRRRKAAVFSDPSPGRAVESRTAATFLQSPQKFRILCQPRRSAFRVAVLSNFQWMVLSFLLMTILWFCVFEVVVGVWLRYVLLHTQNLPLILTRARIMRVAKPAEGTINLGGDEKALLAFTAAAFGADAPELREDVLEEKMEEIVSPAPADL
jgi:hypothetical protein